MLRCGRFKAEAWRRPPVPFDVQLVFDDFPEADRDVVGSVAVIGGTWAANPTPLPSNHIVGHKVVGDLNSENLAAILSAISAPQFAGDWWCRLVLLNPPAAVGANTFGCWLGDDQTGAYAGIACLYPSGGVGQFSFVGGNLGVGDLNAGPLAMDPSVPHEVAFAFTAADGGTGSIIVDDVVLASANPYVLDPSTPLDFAFGGIQDAGGPLVEISEVELGLGPYQ